MRPVTELPMGETGVHGRTVWKSGDADDAAHRLADLAEAGGVALGGRDAEASDLQHYELGVDLVERREVQFPALQGGDPEIADDHVRPLRQLAGEVTALLGAQVEGDRLLITGRHLPPEGGRRSLAGPALRCGSPCCGSSTCTTLAPRLASKVPASGPAITWANSTTFSPLRALASTDIGVLLVLRSANVQRGPARA